jgi:hypothetical protein
MNTSSGSKARLANFLLWAALFLSIIIGLHIALYYLFGPEPTSSEGDDNPDLALLVLAPMLIYVPLYWVLVLTAWGAWTRDKE